MNHKGVEYTLTRSETPGVWKWQFRIGDLVRSGRTEARLLLLAMRRVQLKIDRELKHRRTRIDFLVRGLRSAALHGTGCPVKGRPAVGCQLFPDASIK